MSNTLQTKSDALIEKLKQITSLTRAIEHDLTEFKNSATGSELDYSTILNELETLNTVVNNLKDRLTSLRDERRTQSEAGESIVVSCVSYRYLTISSPPFINPLADWEL